MIETKGVVDLWTVVLFKDGVRVRTVDEVFGREECEALAAEYTRLGGRAGRSAAAECCTLKVA